MRALKGIIVLCFMAIIVFIFLSHIEFPEVGEYRLEISNAPLFHTGWMQFDVTASSFQYMLKYPTITSGLLLFMYFAGIVIVSYAGVVLGLIAAIAGRKEKTDFVFMLSFVACLFFAIFSTALIILKY